MSCGPVGQTSQNKKKPDDSAKCQTMRVNLKEVGAESRVWISVAAVFARLSLPARFQRLWSEECLRV